MTLWSTLLTCSLSTENALLPVQIAGRDYIILSTAQPPGVSYMADFAAGGGGGIICYADLGSYFPTASAISFFACSSL